jgi:hypothetical protein
MFDLIAVLHVFLIWTEFLCRFVQQRTALLRELNNLKIRVGLRRLWS